jgi:hypothetical protein
LPPTVSTSPMRSRSKGITYVFKAYILYSFIRGNCSGAISADITSQAATYAARSKSVFFAGRGVGGRLRRSCGQHLLRHRDGGNLLLRWVNHRGRAP